MMHDLFYVLKGSITSVTKLVDMNLSVNSRHIIFKLFTYKRMISSSAKIGPTDNANSGLTYSPGGMLISAR